MDKKVVISWYPVFLTLQCLTATVSDIHSSSQLFQDFLTNGGSGSAWKNAPLLMTRLYRGFDGGGSEASSLFPWWLFELFGITAWSFPSRISSDARSSTTHLEKVHMKNALSRFYLSSVLIPVSAESSAVFIKVYWKLSYLIKNDSFLCRKKDLIACLKIAQFFQTLFWMG